MSALLREALARWGLEDAEAVFLQHNENMTYRVDGRYLLRIHKPAPGIHAPATHEHRKSELAFLLHLRQQSLPVQEPIADLQGRYVSMLSDGTAATLLTWLPGENLSAAELTGDLCHAIGSMVARLHTAARGFHAPNMRCYNSVWCSHAAKLLDEMTQRHRLGDEQARLFRRACEAVAHSFDHSADAIITIHDDLSRSNILQTPAGLVPIDFSLFGLGRPMTDLGMLMAGINPSAARKAIVEGYVAAGGVFRAQEMEAGFIHGLLGAFLFHADTWPCEPWFADRLLRWNREMLIPFCEGQPLFDVDMNFTTL